MHRDQTECWLAARKAELLPCPYFHITVTVPAELRDVLRTNQRDGYAALMQATAVVPTAALANLVRGKMQALLKKRRPDLVVPEAVWRKPWVVHCTAWGNGADAVLQYLARYVFRIAITSSRIVGLDDNGVTIRHRVRASGRWLRTRLRGHEFMRRFLQHVLPRLASGDMATGICRPREPSLAKSEPARRACSARKPRAEVEREGHGKRQRQHEREAKRCMLEALVVGMGIEEYGVEGNAGREGEPRIRAVGLRIMGRSSNRSDDMVGAPG
jgi:hypothetical protein